MMIKLPEPILISEKSLEAVLHERRSTRRHSSEDLTMAEISQLLWSAQGLNRPRKRTAPSAGALYPIKLYVIHPSGVYKYDPYSHAIESVIEMDKRAEIKVNSPLAIIYCVMYDIIKSKYGRRATRYADIETGHSAQNVLLQAVSLGLAAYPIGAFRESRLRRALQCEEQENPIYMIAIGRPK
jgi:SagB-type dehydrogenase family enzyme